MDLSSILYSVPVGDAKPGETPVHRHPDCKDGLASIPLNLHSFTDIWDMILQKFPHNKLIEDITFQEAFQMSRRVGSWLHSHGHNIFYLYAKNSIEWTVTDIASMNYGFINVPLYDTLGTQAMNYILEVTQGSAVCTVKKLLPNITNLLAENKQNVKEVIIFGEEASPEERKALEDIGMKVTGFSELLAYDQIVERPKLNLQTVITYGFTSGTTGIPKGVVVTHKMGIYLLYGAQKIVSFKETDVHMSFLPIAHCYQRIVTWLCMFFGSNIRYAKYPVTEILKDLAEIKPTTLPLVPKLLNRFYPLLKGLAEKEGNYDKIRAMFGGRVRLIITGSAPISKELLKFFKKALDCFIIEGYGQTETMGASFLTRGQEEEFGYVGGPTIVTELKLVDVPEMNYLTTDNPPRGEICIRGPTVFSEYFKNPEATKATVDSQGWDHTGDIGQILPHNGALRVIDRCKNIFKLQQGEYIAPEKTQNIYVRCKYIAEAFVDGNSLESYCVGIIHPNMEALPMIAAKLGIEQKDPVKLCESDKINAFILNEINTQGKEDGLKGFEMAKKIKLWTKPFIEMKILTSTMKLQRNIAKKVFAEEIKKLYTE